MSSGGSEEDYSLDHQKLISTAELDELLQEWTQCVRQTTAPPEDELAYYGLFGTCGTGQLILHLCRRLGQPSPVFFRALQLFERYMQAHLLEMKAHIVGVDAEVREREWKNLLERIRCQAILRMLSCIQIASKLALHYKIFTTKRVKALLREAKHCFSLESVVNSEVRILKTLKFQVSTPTCLDTLETLLTELQQRRPALVQPLWPALPSAAVRLLRSACVHRSELYLRLYRRTTGRERLVESARRQYAAVLADRTLLAAAVLLAAAYLVRAASSDALLPLLAELTQIPDSDLLELAELLLRDLLPGLDPN